MASVGAHRVLSEPGQPLTPEALGFFEPRFGHDFRAVRIHDGPVAASAARALGARAFTVGSDIVFGAGEYRPAAAAGRNLLAHELEHVIQQRTGEPLGIQRQMVYASGFDSPYARAADEIASFTAGTWAPSSVDFATTAGLARGGTGAATLDAVSSEIKAAQRHSISQLGLIGHAVSGALVLSGTISVATDGVRFGKEGVISTASLLDTDYLNWRDRFAPGATITLYGCNSGMDQELLDTFSQAAGVCVFGFKSAIKWCVASDEAGAIASRGRTRLDSASQTADTGCQTYTADIRTLTPDTQSCAGAPGGGSKSPTGG